ncbi:MAG TPA: hypothetical protein VNY84_08770, partial [Acidimicrobiales bacterium]|nr:hypothetical protein [Acidimicrobiales bacterium]
MNSRYLRACPVVFQRLVPWILRIGWVALPFTAGPALASALNHHPHLRTASSVALWALWAVTLVATLVAHPISLTIVRVVTPATLLALVASASDGHASSVAIGAGGANAALVAALAFLPATALMDVNGPAYPNERRFPLAVPGPLLLGPLPLAWAVAVSVPIAALLLLADRRWIAGAIATVVCVPTVALLGRAMHTLSRRWVVFVPAGLVLHDPLSLEDPVLFQRKVIERLGPAPAATDSLDLTHRAPGLALELVLTEKVPMVRMHPARRQGESGASARLLFTPSRPGAVLAEALRRR